MDDIPKPLKDEERRFGRPPGVDSEDTRRRLLDAAMIVFGQRGYKESSNKFIASSAGITSGAIYHYFPNKQALFLAIHQELQERVLSNAEMLVDNATTLAGALQSLLRFMADSRNNDPHTSAFFSVVRTEAKRNPEISDALDDSRWLSLYDRLALLGVKTGELDSKNFRAFKGVLALCLLGLAQHAAESTITAHNTAVEGLQLMVSGGLLNLNPQTV